MYILYDQKFYEGALATIESGDEDESPRRRKHVRQGSGTMTYPNGRVYKGEWLNDKRHGEGHEIYSNGNVYEGEFVEGKADG